MRRGILRDAASIPAAIFGRTSLRFMSACRCRLQGMCHHVTSPVQVAKHPDGGMLSTITHHLELHRTNASWPLQLREIFDRFHATRLTTRRAGCLAKELEGGDLSRLNGTEHQLRRANLLL